jgi:hypothetical protein
MRNTASQFLPLPNNPFRASRFSATSAPTVAIFAPLIVLITVYQSMPLDGME